MHMRSLSSTMPRPTQRHRSRGKQVRASYQLIGGKLRPHVMPGRASRAVTFCFSSMPTSDQDPDVDLIWSTQWFVPSSTDPNGGKNFHVYAESTSGGPLQCF